MNIRHECFCTALDPPFLSISHNDNFSYLTCNIDQLDYFCLQSSNLSNNKWWWSSLFYDNHLYKRSKACR